MMHLLQHFKKVEEFIENIAKPELIILQCGADGIRRRNPLTHFTIYIKNSQICSRYTTSSITQEYCDGKIIALGGGGYNKKNKYCGADGHKL